MKASRTVSGDRAVPRPEIALPGDPARGVVLQGIVVAAVLTVALLLAWHPLEDLDIWFHLRAGTDQLAHGPLPALNQYSFTEPRHPWLNHEWLFQALVHATASHDALPAVDAAGWNLLRTALAGLLALLLVLGDGGLARLQGRADGTAAPGTGLVLLAALGLLWPRLMLRPELLSYIAIVLLVRWTEGLGTEVARDGLGALRPRRWLDPRTSAGRVWWLVLIWAQAHGFSSVAPLIVGIGLVGGTADGRLRRPTSAAWRAAGLGVLAMLVALLATPNGWQGLVFPLRAIGQFRGADADLRRTVAELTPLLASPDALHATILLFKLSLIAGVLLAVTGWRRIGLLRLVLWAATAAAAFATQRALGPYAVAFALLGMRYAPSLPLVSVPVARLSSRARVAWAVGMATAVVAGAAWWTQGIVSNGFYLAEGVARRYGDGLATAQYPLIAAGRLAGSRHRACSRTWARAACCSAPRGPSSASTGGPKPIRRRCGGSTSRSSVAATRPWRCSTRAMSTACAWPVPTAPLRRWPVTSSPRTAGNSRAPKAPACSCAARACPLAPTRRRCRKPPREAN
ncbi:MAG: hypothetical protein IPG61_04310 [bacterium]|nr:hypothetical protein [bacterium]